MGVVHNPTLGRRLTRSGLAMPHFIFIAPARRLQIGDTAPVGRDCNPDCLSASCFILSAAPARRPQKGDAKVRTGVRRRSGRVTGAGGEASKARNAGVCLRAGWRLRRPAADTPSASVARRLRRTRRPNAERRRRTHGGREQVSGRSAGSTRATVVPKSMRIRGCAGLAR